MPNARNATKCVERIAPVIKGHFLHGCDLVGIEELGFAEGVMITPIGAELVECGATSDPDFGPD